MIGRRISVTSERFPYIFGLLIDEGLVGNVDFMPVGAAEIVVTNEAFDRLDSEAVGEIVRFSRPGSEIADVAVAVASPAGGGDKGQGSGGDEAPRRTRATRSTTKKEK